MAIPRKARKNPRAQVSLVARYRSPTAFEYVEEECHDLSLGGMFIRSMAPAPAGTLIKLECDVAGGGQAIRGVARVVWLRDSSDDAHPAGMGVKFIKLDPGARDAIKAILDQLMTLPEDGTDAPEPIESQRVLREPDPIAPEPAEAIAEPADERPSHDLVDDARVDAETIEEMADAAAQEQAAEFDAAAAEPDVDAPAAARAASARSRRPSSASRALKYGFAGLAVAAAALALLLARRPAANLVASVAPQPVRELAPSPIAAPVAVPAAPLPAPAPPPRYVLDVITNPSGAEVAAGERRWPTPARIELEALPEAVEFAIAKDGFETTKLRVDQRGFALEDGEWRRRLVLSLTPAPVVKSKPREATRASAPAHATGEDSPQLRLKNATRCLAHGDNRCVIRTLEGKASTARELELLVETYRATGNLPKAQQSMRAYVDKYPTGDRATGYRQVLDRQRKQPPRPRG